MTKPVIYISQILRWADEFHRKARRWPKPHDGPVPRQGGLTWLAVDRALRNGNRGLPGKSSLARLLDEQRGARNHKHLPPFTIRGILSWAAAHHRRTGRWPTTRDGPVVGAPGETWLGVDSALRTGNRGLSVGSSLAMVLHDRLGVRNHMALPPLRKNDILKWADRHKKRTGRWPSAESGPVVGAPPGETWLAISTALEQGHRGWPGGSSLARFLAQYRGVRNRKRLPPLDVARIRAAILAYHRRQGRFPMHISEPIPEMPGETWSGVHKALCCGARGLPGGGSLYHLRRSVAQELGLPVRLRPPPKR